MDSPVSVRRHQPLRQQTLLVQVKLTQHTVHCVLLDVDVEHKWRAGPPVLRVTLTEAREAVWCASHQCLLRVRQPTYLIVTEDVELAYEVRVRLPSLHVSVRRL